MTKENEDMAQGPKPTLLDSPKPASDKPTDGAKTRAAQNSVGNTGTSKTNKPTASTMPNTSRSQNSPSPKSGKALMWVMLLLNICFIGAAGYAGFVGWQYWNTFQQEMTTQRQQDQTILQNQLSTQLQTAMQNQDGSLSKQLSAFTNQLDNQNQKIEEIFDHTQRISGAQSGQWQASEALFLIRMAGKKLWLEKDGLTALMLLKQADQQLANVADSRLFTVRQKIASDVVALETISYTNSTQRVMQLQALYSQIDTLHIAQPTELLAEDSANSATVGLDTTTATELNSTWGKAKQWLKDNILDVTRHDQPISPFISQKQQWFVKEQLGYQLLIAQNALFREQPEIFQGSIKQSKELLERFFNMNNAQSKMFAKVLSELAQHEFGSPYPEVLESESALNALLNGLALSPSNDKSIEEGRGL